MFGIELINWSPELPGTNDFYRCPECGEESVVCYHHDETGLWFPHKGSCPNYTPPPEVEDGS